LLGFIIVLSKINKYFIFQYIFQQRNLFKREAEIIASSMIELILSGVRTPERPSSPQNAFMTEEDIFVQKNPSVIQDYF
jgi:hypothetical protein